MTIPSSEADSAIERAELERLYLAMARIRSFEDAVMRAFTSGEIRGTTHLCSGQEATSVGVCDALGPEDVVAATYRGHGAALALGCDPEALFAEFLGREGGICGGRGGSMNVIDLNNRLLGCFGIVGGSIGAATGAALAAELTGDGTVAAAFFGDGAVNQAYFHECLNFAAVRRLPIVYACENNLYGEWTHMSHVTAGGGLASRAEAYGVPAEVVDGNDVLAVRAAARVAVERARAGDGPAFLELLTYRHHGHSRSDPGKYRPREEVDEWMTRDPLPRLAIAMDDDTAAGLSARAEREMEAALDAARARAEADPAARASALKEPA
jgi:acetoin:2,6-dichlorophenolindophenol oxidoreductase subunit alpha